MLIAFGALCSKFTTKGLLKIPPHLEHMSLHYLVKHLISKIATTESSATADQALTH